MANQSWPKPLTLVADPPANFTLGGGVIEKIAGVVGWNSQVYSQEGYMDGISISFKVDPTADVMAGLDSDPTVDPSHENIDHTIYCPGLTDPGGAAHIRENGSFVVSAGIFTANTVFSIVYGGGFVRYYNGSTLVHTTAVTPGTQLFFDSSFANVGAKLIGLSIGLPNPSPSYGFESVGRIARDQGRRVLNASSVRAGKTMLKFNVEWVLLDSEVAAFKTFFEGTLLDGVLPFDVQLASGDGLETHTVKFENATYAQPVQHGLMHSIRATLLCYNPPLITEAELDVLLAIDPADLDTLYP